MHGLTTLPRAIAMHYAIHHTQPHYQLHYQPHSTKLNFTINYIPNYIPFSVFSRRWIGVSGPYDFASCTEELDANGIDRRIFQA